MTTKTTISFTDRHHQFAAKKVEEGVYASVSSLVAASIEQAIQDEEERKVALDAMGDTIRKRMQTPRETWIKHDRDDSMFDRLRGEILNT